MSGTEDFAAVPGTGDHLRVLDFTIGGETRKQEVVSLGSPNTQANLAEVLAAAPALTDPGVVVRATGPVENIGTFGYVAASGISSAAANLTVPGRCLSVSVVAIGADASFSIGSGNAIVVRAGYAKDITPRGVLTGAVITWVSGVFDAFAEYV